MTNRMQIVDSYLALTALREAGYRSTATAIAELIDNSIEAKATSIDIVTLSKLEAGKERATYRVQEIAVIDNGEGMDVEDLSRCLSLGWGTRLATRASLGRFGYGLKGSSISQARSVRVISWRNNDAYEVDLDLDEIEREKSQFLKSVRSCKVPSTYKEHFASSNGASGTIVIWSKLDGVDFKRPETLLNRMNGDLCRIYRHFLDDDNAYGERVQVKLHDFDLDAGRLKQSHELLPNDPLYLLQPSNAPGSEGEVTNVPFEKPYTIPVEYAPNKWSKIEIRTSIAKPEVQNKGGNSILGRHYGSNAGISFVRAGREIDFGSFGFIEPSEPRHRWWGVEVRFMPELDELFGVTNNKQHIRGFRKLNLRQDTELVETLRQTAEDPESDARFKAKMQLALSKNLEAQIDKMMDIIKNRNKERLNSEDGPAAVDSLVKKVNADLSKDDAETLSDELAKQKSYQDKLAERRKFVDQTHPELGEEDRARLAEETVGYKIDLKKDSWPGNTFLDTQTVATAVVGVINTRSPFYQKFWEHLEDADDDMGITALQVFTMAYIRTEDEMRQTTEAKLFERLRDRWGYWVDKLMTHVGE